MKLCPLSLSTRDIAKYKKAIDQFYYFEMEYDHLPVYGFVGAVVPPAVKGGPSKYYYFAHLHFHIVYNKDQVSVTTEKMEA